MLEGDQRATNQSAMAAGVILCCCQVSCLAAANVSVTERADEQRMYTLTQQLTSPWNLCGAFQQGPGFETTEVAVLSLQS
ncbi:MAG: hypothetical protein FRX49_09530 [Trebouxia sp. A1-2]|nr:MAG: hypothetical protein FRX49_09530 [Trebouxia sp. A1-2]